MRLAWPWILRCASARVVLFIFREILRDQVHARGSTPNRSCTTPGINAASSTIHGLLSKSRLTNGNPKSNNLRHPVVPGDQLILEATAVRVKSRTGHVRCKAFVTDKLAAEADIKFMLVDAEPV